MSNPPSPTEPDNEEEYLGNIWGWKFSFISLGIIVAMLLLMWYRSATMDKSPLAQPQDPPIEGDSTLIIEN